MMDSSENGNLKESFKEFVVDFAEQEQQKSRERQRAAQKENTIRRARMLLRVAGIVVAVLLCGRLYASIVRELRLFPEPDTWVMGGVSKDDTGAQECVRRLWVLRAAADRYYALHNKYPAALSELYEAGLLKRPFVCPTSKQEYLLVEKEDELLYICPLPGQHGLAFLGGDLKSGAPRARHPGER